MQIYVVRKMQSVELEDKRRNAIVLLLFNSWCVNPWCHIFNGIRQHRNTAVLCVSAAMYYTMILSSLSERSCSDTSCDIVYE